MLPNQLHTWLSQFNRQAIAAKQTGIELTPEIARQTLATLTHEFSPTSPTIDTVIDGELTEYQLPYRIYSPSPKLPLPIMLFIHGGGHMCGDIEVYDHICRRLAIASQATIISVDYYRAPEHPYPQALKQLSKSLDRWEDIITKHGIQHNEQFYLAGDSAGGALATSLIAETAQQEINKLILIYPSLDYSEQAPSLKRFAQGYLLEKDKISWYFKHYLQHDEERSSISPLFSPIRSDHPATLIVTADHCPIQDDGFRYANRLRQAGISVSHHHLQDTIHAFLNLESLANEACEQTYHHIGEFLSDSIIVAHKQQ